MELYFLNQVCYKFNDLEYASILHLRQIQFKVSTFESKSDTFVNIKGLH